jgi:uncharacterized SAM-binding protein YcdF (DUF218 family)
MESREIGPAHVGAKPPARIASALLNRKGLRCLVVALAVSLFAVALLWVFPHELLCIDDGERRADVLVVLGGGMAERHRRAAELFHEGVAPRILVTGNGKAETRIQELTKAGVPEQAIQEEWRATSTKDNALLAIPLLRENRAKAVVIVTSWYHSRRALQCFRHFAPDIQFYSRPSYWAFARADWARLDIAKNIRAEYIKLPGYWLRYGVQPF